MRKRIQRWTVVVAVEVEGVDYSQAASRVRDALFDQGVVVGDVRIRAVVSNDQQGV
jgi:hypothetical protein